jgi:glyoxylase-like metal-dependent hydrolase (beta-lactamase superfamily II)
MAHEADLPAASLAEVHILFEGYVGERVASTIAFVREGEVRVIIDPGMAPSPRAMLDPLAALGVTPEAITDVIFSHHHPDHTLNAALFPNARFHDFQAIYKNDIWERRRAEGFQLAPSIRLIETPGHTPQDITTLVGTSAGVFAFTHLWWHARGPLKDPYAPDPAILQSSRERVLQLATTIVPGHGSPFTPGPETPR